MDDGNAGDPDLCRTGRGGGRWRAAAVVINFNKQEGGRR